ncbi:M1 family metallopeptidase [Nocardioides cavernaquae]|uniref:Aminopeptidase N n=1 Tax=Nocardioides cavernaquae TaxID=2321396 RepID=A0A3A5H4W7_9ACTN|nr:M1 family metallopeptidase [Nocardioides cavernaquae]RJS45662.1 M1 family peptidase [Nocardioides cavernaquae]
MPGTDPYVPGHGNAAYDVEHYDLDLRYKPAGNRLDAEATLRCVALDELDNLVLDLHHLRVTRVSVAGHGVDKFAHRNDKLRIRLKSPVLTGERFSVTVKYSGAPTAVKSRALGDAGWEELDDGVIVAAQPHGAPSWFPCNDRPDNKATYAISISAPSDYHVAFSGALLSSSRSGASTTWSYEQTAPMATYLATVQIGRYVVSEQPGVVPIRVVRPADVRGPAYDASFGQQPKMMQFFTERFGPYPFEGYTTVITNDDLEIPLESQSLSTFGRNFASAEWSEVRLVAHELAHQWFGNAVTLRHWKDIWLHEGFACYSEWLWSEQAGPKSTAEWVEHYHRKLSDLPQDLVLADPTPDLMFDDRVYKRGALTLHALRITVGDEAFFEILRRWVADNNGGTITTPQFVIHCEEISGKPLAGLFRDWLEETALPPLPAS